MDTYPIIHYQPRCACCTAGACQGNGEAPRLTLLRPFRGNGVYRGEALLLLKTGAKTTRRICMSLSSNMTRKGGFLQGIPQVSTLPVRSLATSGCCGSTDQPSNTGCCGEPITLTNEPATAQQGCCGEPAVASQTAAQATGYCGEPVTQPSKTSATTPSGCCN